MNYRELVLKAALSPSDVATITKRSKVTVSRWYRTNQAPQAVIDLLNAYTGRQLPTAAKEWQGWSIMNGLLVDPDGIGYTPKEIKQIWLYRQIKQEYKRRNTAPAQYLLNL